MARGNDVDNFFHKMFIMSGGYGFSTQLIFDLNERYNMMAPKCVSCGNTLMPEEINHKRCPICFDHLVLKYDKYTEEQWKEVNDRHENNRTREFIMATGLIALMVILTTIGLISNL
jgi:predicted RNA-binding Zn-ribbon protein involved in translation (DUF1610 family)